MKIVFKGLKHYRLFGLNPNGKIIDCSLSNNGERIETSFRYFMLAIKSVHSGSIVLFCKLRFYKGDNPNDCYQWCLKMISFEDLSQYVEGIKWAGATGSSGEELDKGLTGMGPPNDEVEELPGTYYSYGKLCYDKILSYSKDTIVDRKTYKKYEMINGLKCACFAYDVDKANIGRKIDTLLYNKWCWFSANDTYGYNNKGNRNMTSFDLYMSNDRKTWQLMDSANISSPTDKSNFEMIYSNNIYPHFTIDETTKKKKYTTITLEI